MKKGLLLLLAAAFVLPAFAYNYDTKVPVPGKTLADGKLQSEMHRIVKILQLQIQKFLSLVMAAHGKKYGPLKPAQEPQESLLSLVQQSRELILQLTRWV